MIMIKQTDPILQQQKTSNNKWYETEDSLLW